MKEWECMEVKKHKDIGRTIEEWQNDGWRLHTYQCMHGYYYLLLEKGTDS